MCSSENQWSESYLVRRAEVDSTSYSILRALQMFYITLHEIARPTAREWLMSKFLSNLSQNTSSIMQHINRLPHAVVTLCCLPIAYIDDDTFKDRQEVQNRSASLTEVV